MSRSVAFWLLLLWVVIGCQSAPVVDVAASVQPLTVEAPPTVAVGEPFDVVVTAADNVDLPITLTLLGSYGSRFVAGTLQNGGASIRVPGELTRQSGLTTLTATGAGYSGSATTTFIAGAAVEPLTPLVGARSIVADGASWAMTVIVPFDRFNNPLANGTPFTVRVRHPDQSVETLRTETDHLLAWERVYSGTKAGRSTITVEGEGAFGPAADLLEVAGWPERFTLSATYDHLEADGRQLVTIQSDEIVDRFGNMMPDGTQVLFVVEDMAGKRTLPAVTIDGSAETTLQAPDQPQTVSITALVYDRASEPLTLAFRESVTDFTVLAQQSESGAIAVTAGPVLGALNQYVPDGTRATITVGDTVVEAQVRDGYVRRDLLGVERVDMLSVQIGSVVISAEIEDQP